MVRKVVKKNRDVSVLRNKFILGIAIILFLALFFFVLLNLVMTGKYTSIDIVSPRDNLNYLSGESFNLTLNVSCHGENCEYIYVGLARENVSTLYAASGLRGIDVYSTNDAGMINQMHNVYVEDFSLSIWGDENYIYSANGDRGLSVYDVNQIGKPELVASDNRGGYALSVWGDENYIYLANEQKGLEVYTMGEEGLTHMYNGYQEGGFAYGVWGDGNYIYVADGILGLEVYQLDENGLTFLYNDSQEGGYALSVWGDGNYIYVADEWNGVEVYSINESGLNMLYNASQEGSYAASVWGDGNYIYVAQGESGINVYSLDENGLNLENTISPSADNSEAYFITGDGNYIYLADGENGVEVYSIDGNDLVHTYNNYHGGYVSALLKRSQNGVFDDFFRKPFFIEGINYSLVNLNENESQLVNFEINADGELDDSLSLFAYSYMLSDNSSLNTSSRIVLKIGEHTVLQSPEVCTNCSVSSSSSGGGSGGSSDVESCTYDPNFDWGCGEWSKCKSGEQTRICKEFNNCNTLEGKPITTQSCVNAKPRALFDINLLLTSNPIRIGEIARLIIGLINIGDPGQVNATLHYQIKDSSGALVHEESEVVGVETQGEFIKEIDTSKLKTGEYIISVDLTYPGQLEPAKAETTLNIAVPIVALYSRNKFYVFVFAGFLVILAGLLIRKIWLKRNLSSSS